jgi:phage tail-like protein
MPRGINPLFAASSGPVGIRLDPYVACNFLVEMEGLLAGGFREVSGLESSVNVTDYAEGGQNGYAHKILGETRYPNLVLSRGLTDLDTLWAWYDDVAHGAVTRKNITVMLLDGRRLPVMWWDIRGAVPVKWVGPTLNASRSGEVAVESVELVHRGITKPPQSRALSALRAATGQLFK